MGFAVFHKLQLTPPTQSLTLKELVHHSVPEDAKMGSHPLLLPFFFFLFLLAGRASDGQPLLECSACAESLGQDEL